jgi:DNA-binding response OmpR family regulator
MREKRLFLLESNTTVRDAIHYVLCAEGYDIQACDSLPQLIAHAPFADGDFALLAWQSMDGLLSETHRHDMAQLAELLPIVLIVPRRWLRLLTPGDFSVTALLPKPFDPEELRTCVHHNLGTTQVGSRSARQAQDGR